MPTAEHSTQTGDAVCDTCPLCGARPGSVRNGHNDWDDCRTPPPKRRATSKAIDYNESSLTPVPSDDLDSPHSRKSGRPRKRSRSPSPRGARASSKVRTPRAAQFIPRAPQPTFSYSAYVPPRLPQLMVPGVAGYATAEFTRALGQIRAALKDVGFTRGWQALVYRPPVEKQTALCDHCNTTLYLAYRSCRVCGTDTCLECRDAVPRIGGMPRCDKGRQNHTWLLCTFVPPSLLAAIERVLPKADCEEVKQEVSELKETDSQPGVFSPDKLPEESVLQGSSCQKTASRISQCVDCRRRSGQEIICRFRGFRVLSSDFTEVVGFIHTPWDGTLNLQPLHKAPRPLPSTRHSGYMSVQRFPCTPEGVREAQALFLAGMPCVIKGYVPRGCSPQVFREAMELWLSKQGSGMHLFMRHVREKGWLPAQMTVDEFWNRMEQGENKADREPCKVKDFPPGGGVFQDYFADLHKYLMDTLPEFVLPKNNMDFLLPPDFDPPDLFGKMYMAESHEGAEVTTETHKDIADAWNLLLWNGGPSVSEDTTEDEAGEDQRAARGDAGAVWDLYGQQDYGTINDYMQEVFKQPFAVHSQRYYLAPEHRAELRDRGVAHWRIYQRVGELVLIPSGSVHQVRNIRNSVKVASDFICPNHVRYTAQTRDELRQVPPKWLNRKDKLQLNATLFFTCWSLLNKKSETPEK
eukprot:TRINITY_DN14739_c0_g1_i1.p1 TRINITY_DN14739_c0_g1~~TRINITY_DN14739_c0_g1_i1.p1  ORF type:complete len:700 (+),score=71.29 TRINITY_DN14739_c0_g1_i1:26-2101(+)